MSEGDRIIYTGNMYPTYQQAHGIVTRVRNDGYLVLLDNGAQFVATADALCAVSAQQAPTPQPQTELVVPASPLEEMPEAEATKTPEVGQETEQ